MIGSDVAPLERSSLHGRDLRMALSVAAALEVAPLARGACAREVARSVAAPVVVCAAATLVFGLVGQMSRPANSTFASILARLLFALDAVALSAILARAVARATADRFG